MIITWSDFMLGLWFALVGFIIYAYYRERRDRGKGEVQSGFSI